MENKNLVVIDDDPTYRGLIADAFGAEFAVRGAADGEQGLADCKTAPPDVVLLDLRMPRVNGLEVLRGLAADPATAAVPVVVFSASHVDAGLRAQLDAFPNVRARLDKLTKLSRVLEALRAA